MTYNVGGLSTDMYDSLMTYLNGLPREERPHSVMLQETHLRDSLEFQTEGYHVVTSSSLKQPKASGVMALISYDLVPRHQASRLKFEEALHGRVLHMRVEEVVKTCDFINVYQKVQSGGAHDMQVQAQRQRVWEPRNVPGRNLLVIAGDMNTQAEEKTGLIGPCLGLTRGRDSDLHMYMNIITQFQLILFKRSSHRYPWMRTRWTRS